MSDEMPITLEYLLSLLERQVSAAYVHGDTAREGLDEDAQFLLAGIDSAKSELAGLRQLRAVLEKVCVDLELQGYTEWPAEIRAAAGLSLTPSSPTPGKEPL